MVWVVGTCNDPLNPQKEKLLILHLVICISAAVGTDFCHSESSMILRAE